MTWENMQVPGLMEDRTIDRALDFFRIQERGPYYGWVSYRSHSRDFIGRSGDPHWRQEGKCSG